MKLIKIQRKEVKINVLFRCNELQRLKIKQHFFEERLSIEGTAPIHSRCLLFSSFRNFEYLGGDERLDLQHVEVTFVDYDNGIFRAEMIFY